MAFWTKKSEISPASSLEQSVPSTSVAASSSAATPSPITLKPEEKDVTAAASAAALVSPKTATPPREAPAEQSAPRGLVRTAIGAGTKIQGKLSFDTPVQIDGDVRGEIFSSKHLIIGKTAHVEATLIAPSITVLGFVAGSIVAAEKLEIKAAASVTGNVASTVLILEEGGLLNASVSMGLDETAKEALSQRVEKSSEANKTELTAAALAARTAGTLSADAPTNSQIH